jgi:hypothetical protein
MEVKGADKLKAKVSHTKMEGGGERPYQHARKHLLYQL